MAEAHGFPAQPYVEGQPRSVAVIILHECRIVRGHEVSRRIAKGRLNGGDAPPEEILESGAVIRVVLTLSELQCC